MPRGQGTEQRRNPASGCSAPRPTGPANSQEPSVGFRVNKRRGAAHGKGTWLVCPIFRGDSGMGRGAQPLVGVQILPDRWKKGEKIGFYQQEAVGRLCGSGAGSAGEADRRRR